MGWEGGNKCKISAVTFAHSSQGIEALWALPLWVSRAGLLSWPRERTLANCVSCTMPCRAPTSPAFSVVELLFSLPCSSLGASRPMSPPGSTPVGSEALISSIVFFRPKQTCKGGGPSRRVKLTECGTANAARRGSAIPGPRTGEGLAAAGLDCGLQGCHADPRVVKRHGVGPGCKLVGRTWSGMLVNVKLIQDQRMNRGDTIRSLRECIMHLLCARAGIPDFMPAALSCLTTSNSNC